MVKEKRKFERVPLKVQVFVRDKEYNGTIYFYSSNISKKGMFLESELLLDEGTEFVFEFTLPSSPKFIRTKGKVVWVTRPGAVGVDINNPPGMGIEFVEISPDNEREVEAFIEKKLRK